MRFRLSVVVTLALLPALSGSATAEAVVPQAVLVAGPLAGVAPLWSGDVAAKEVAFVPEIDVAGAWPAAGDGFAWRPGDEARFERRPAGPDGVTLDTGGDSAPAWVTWIAFYARADRYGKIDVVAEASAALRLYVDGAEVASAVPDSVSPAPTVARATSPWRRGTHRILVRVERKPDEEGAVKLRLEPAENAMRVATSIDPRHAPADYEAFHAVAVPTSLLLSPDGSLLARSLETRSADGTTFARLDVIDLAGGSVRAANLGGSGAHGVAWRHDGGALLFRSGNSLYVWDRSGGGVEQVLDNEPGLGPVSWSPDGSLLVVQSTRGVPDENGKQEGPVRLEELREKLTDWPTSPHLHAILLGSDAGTGATRRRLAVPGDWVQDNFEILADSRTLVALRNVPADARPWLQTEVRTLDLVSGAARLVATLHMGFEDRPGLLGMAASPDGRRIAFVGPPSELGDQVSVEPNAYDPDLWVLDLTTGAVQSVTEGFAPAVNGPPHWTPDSQALWFEATDGSRNVLARAAFSGDAWKVATHGAGGERVQGLTFAGDGPFAAVVSDTDHLPQLVAGNASTDVTPRTVETPNAALEARWALPAAEPVPVTSADGTSLDAWLFRPDPSARVDKKLPLIVYYYGGATPTMRGWNELFAFLLGNGYAVFTINPRGANGYGRAFADEHVDDWGEKAGADILSGVEAVLAAHDDLDPARVGCFGGSYGGFMTMWLVAHTGSFAAAVSLYGIADLASYWGAGTWGWTYGDQAMARKYPWSDAAWFTDHSPLYLANRVRTPLLLMHGDADRNVPPVESTQMFTALKILGRPVELVRFPGEDHGLRDKWEDRVAHREMLLEWFDRYLRNQPEAWQARWK